jgi:hypothetical protein
MKEDEEESRFGSSEEESRFGSSEEDDGKREDDNSRKKKRLNQKDNSRRVKAKKDNDHEDKDEASYGNGDEADAREKKRLYQRGYRQRVKARMSVDPVFAAKERKKLRDRVRRNRAGNSKKKNRAGNSKKKRMRIGPNNTILPIEVSCKWLYLEDKNMLKVTMTQKLEEGTPEYDYLMIMMGDDELLVVFDNVMPQEEFSLLIKSSINQFKNSSEVLDQMRIFKKEGQD